MISLLIIQPTTSELDIKRPPPNQIDRELATRSVQTVDDFNSAEETYMIRLIAWYFVILILPAILTLFYITLNPDAFMIDITSKIDFSTWQPGQKP